MSFFNYLILIISISSFCISNVKGVNASKEPFSFQKKNTGLVKSSQNKDLKIELTKLEEDFKSDYDEIKIHYKEKMLSLKELQKSEVKGLKKNYNNRRRAIYKKYGVKPPKIDKNSSSGTDLYKPTKESDMMKKTPLQKPTK